MTMSLDDLKPNRDAANELWQASIQPIITDTIGKQANGEPRHQKSFKKAERKRIVFTTMHSATLKKASTRGGHGPSCRTPTRSSSRSNIACRTILSLQGRGKATLVVESRFASKTELALPPASA
jgi:hypothetical protein